MAFIDFFGTTAIFSDIIEIGTKNTTIGKSWNAGKESILTTFQTSFSFGPHSSKVKAVLNHYIEKNPGP